MAAEFSKYYLTSCHFKTHPPGTDLQNGNGLFHFKVLLYYLLFYYYRYSALGPVWAETRAQSGDWYSSGTLHPGQVLRGRVPFLSPAF